MRFSLKAHPRPLPQHETLSFVHTHTHSSSIFINLLSLSRPVHSIVSFFFYLSVALFLSCALNKKKKKKQLPTSNPPPRVTHTQCVCEEKYTGGLWCVVHVIAQVQVLHFLLYTTIEVVAVCLFLSSRAKRESEWKKHSSSEALE